MDVTVMINGFVLINATIIRNTTDSNVSMLPHAGIIPRIKIDRNAETDGRRESK